MGMDRLSFSETEDVETKLTHRQQPLPSAPLLHSRCRGRRTGRRRRHPKDTKVHALALAMKVFLWTNEERKGERGKEGGGEGKDKTETSQTERGGGSA